MSLRSKLLAILIILPLLTLGLYLLMATDLFKSDKIAYASESSLTVARGLAAQVRMESQTVYGSLRSVAEQFDFNQKTFNADGQSLFGHTANLLAIVIYRKDASGAFVRQGQLLKPDLPEAQKFAADDAGLEGLRDEAIRSGAFLGESTSIAKSLVSAFKLGESTDANQAVILGLYRGEDLLNAFLASGNFFSFAMTRSGRTAFGAMNSVVTDHDQLQKLAGERDAVDGATEAQLSDGKEYLIAHANVGLGDMVVISKVDKSRALSAVQILLRKSFEFFAALIASTFLISLFLSYRMTSTIRELFDATERMASGDFNVKVEPRSTDEVGGLAHGFNFMAGEVSRLMKETAESARMEGELHTVRTVQETLFPPSHSQFGPINIVGHFEPASECGGDWWNYSRIGSKIFLWIGDATGHGAPAALITAAARSAAAVIEAMPDMTPARAMTVLNRAIQQTSKGSIMMTFFIAAIDLDEKTFTYACASHDPPYLLKNKAAKLVKKDLIPLNEVNGPRLGDQKDFVYDEVKIAFAEGDLLFLYTDGLLDIEDVDGKKWGERAFLKSLIDNANDGLDLDEKLEGLKDQIADYRQGAALIDDVTMVMCKFESRSA